MIRLLSILLFFSACSGFSCTAQNMADYNGLWSGVIDAKALSHELVLVQHSDQKWQLQLSNGRTYIDASYTSESEKSIVLRLDETSTLRGSKTKDGHLSVFVNSRGYQYHVLLKSSGNNTFRGSWYPFYFDEFMPSELYLAIEEGQGESYAAYPLIRDNRFRGTYVGRFEKEKDVITFSDQNTPYVFKGILKGDKIELGLYLFGHKATTVMMKRDDSDLVFGTTAERKLAAPPTSPMQKGDGIQTAKLATFTSKTQTLDVLGDSIKANALTHVHSVLISKKGQLIYENYFNGFHDNIAHDQRSAAKSIGSAMIGIALEDGIIESLDQSIYDFIPEKYRYTKDDKKGKITLRHLLTMSSGLDAIDFGVERRGQATEDNYQMSSDWLKTVLEAPMIFEAGEHCNYGSANPFLLSVGLANVLDESLLSYMDRKLLSPLKMTNYSISRDDKGQPYFGGGSYLTPRDMLKFGELYRNKGIWNGQRILSEKWVNDSFGKYKILENTNNKNQYGFLWWHQTYMVNGKKIESVEARGAGGQYIAVIDQLDMTIVITSGNYRNGRFWQPEMIIEDYILPAFVAQE